MERETVTGEYDNSGDEDDKKYEIDSDEDDLPFKCFICRNSFTDPVVTKYVKIFFVLFCILTLEITLITGLPFILDANIIFVKNALWSNIGKVHDVIYVTSRLMARLIPQKNLLHERK